MWVVSFHHRSGGRLRLGHLDGKNSVYDTEGQLILDSDEVLLSKHIGVDLNVTKSWRTWFMNSVIETEAGSFSCFMTDKRMVFIRNPDPWKAGAYLMTPYGAAGGIADSYRAKWIAEAGGFEYYEVCLEDIKHFKAYRNCVDLLIMSSEGVKHRATVMNGGARPPIRRTLLKVLVLKKIPSV